MNEKASVRGKLLELLAQAGFAERYYAYCDSHPLDFSVRKPTIEARQKALAALGLSTRYVRREDYHEHRETHEHFTFALLVRGGSPLEMILHVETEHGCVGDSYQSLARDIALLKDPAFARYPPYPWISISKAEGLDKAVEFGVSLFHLAKGAVLGFDGWDALLGKAPP